MHTYLDSIAGDVLGSIDSQLDVLDGLADRHLQSELELYVAREPSRESEFHSYSASERRSGFVGATIVPTPALESSRVEALCNVVEAMGGPVAALRPLHACLRVVEEFQELYEGGQYFATGFAEWRRALTAYIADARRALEIGDESYEKWRKSRVPEAHSIGTTIGKDVLLSMADITVLTGKTEDAARRLMREKGITVYRIGKRKFVKGDDLLDATEDDQGSA